MHFRVGGGISWKEQADVILASLSVGGCSVRATFVLVAVILQLRVIVNSHELCLTKLELDKDFEGERRSDAGSITVNLKCV